MALPYYIGEMVKSMSQDSIVLEAELEMQGYPNLFKSTRCDQQGVGPSADMA